MPPMTRPEAVATLRDAVTALTARLGAEFGDLVPDASVERTAALAAALERGEAGGVAPDHLRTLDSWIRLADSAVLHDDPAEARTRADLARRLRTVRTLVAPGDDTLTGDSRND